MQRPPWKVDCDQCQGTFDARAITMTTVVGAAPITGEDRVYCPRCYGRIYGFKPGMGWIPAPDDGYERIPA